MRRYASHVCRASHAARRIWEIRKKKKRFSARAARGQKSIARVALAMKSCFSAASELHLRLWGRFFIKKHDFCESRVTSLGALKCVAWPAAGAVASRTLEGTSLIIPFAILEPMFTAPPFVAAFPDALRGRRRGAAAPIFFCFFNETWKMR